MKTITIEASGAIIVTGMPDEKIGKLIYTAYKKLPEAEKDDLEMFVNLSSFNGGGYNLFYVEDGKVRESTDKEWDDLANKNSHNLKDFYKKYPAVHVEIG